MVVAPRMVGWSVRREGPHAARAFVCCRTLAINGRVLKRRYLRHMFEHRSRPLVPRRVFLLRQLRFFLAAMVIVAGSLAIGTGGYMHFAHQRAIDAFLNASMILAGMGPIGELPNDAAKLFASFYALYSGIALLTTVAVILAPLVHRMLHALHLEDASRDTD